MSQESRMGGQVPFPAIIYPFPSPRFPEQSAGESPCLPACWPSRLSNNLTQPGLSCSGIVFCGTSCLNPGCLPLGELLLPPVLWDVPDLPTFSCHREDTVRFRGPPSWCMPSTWDCQRLLGSSTALPNWAGPQGSPHWVYASAGVCGEGIEEDIQASGEQDQAAHHAGYPEATAGDLGLLTRPAGHLHAVGSNLHVLLRIL